MVHAEVALELKKEKILFQSGLLYPTKTWEHTPWDEDRFRLPEYIK